MLIIIIGLILLVVGFQMRKQGFPTSKYAGAAFGGGALLMMAGFLTNAVVQIDPGQVGVQVLFGKVQNDSFLGGGLHLVNPFTEIVRFDTRTQNYTMSAVHDEGSKQGDDAIKVLSADGLEVVIDLTVLYRVVPNQAPSILEKIGTDYENVIVRPITRTKTRDVAVYYDAVSLFSTQRDIFQARITKDIEADFHKRGLVLEQLLVRNINLPTSVKESIESKINAEQEAQKMQFVLQKEKQEAERKRVEAQGIADYQKILSTGLSDKQLQYEMIKAQKELALSPNAKVIVLGGKGNTPLLISDK